MIGGQSVTSDGVPGMVKLEDQLAAVLDEAAGEVAHTECFDVEQRAEVYTILRTLRSDTRQHRELLALLALSAGREVPDA